MLRVFSTCVLRFQGPLAPYLLNRLYPKKTLYKVAPANAVPYSTSALAHPKGMQFLALLWRFSSPCTSFPFQSSYNYVSHDESSSLSRPDIEPRASGGVSVPLCWVRGT